MLDVVFSPGVRYVGDKHTWTIALTEEQTLTGTRPSPNAKSSIMPRPVASTTSFRFQTRPTTEITYEQVQHSLLYYSFVSINAPDITDLMSYPHAERVSNDTRDWR